MNSLWLPTDEELIEILGSKTAQNAWSGNRVFESSRSRLGETLRVAYLLEAEEDGSESVVVIGCASQVELQSFIYEEKIYGSPISGMGELHRF